MLVGDIGEGVAVGVRAGCHGERVVVPLFGDKPSLHGAAVEVGHDSGPTHTEAFGELHDRVACVVAVDECVDVFGAKSALDSMSFGGSGSAADVSGSLLAGRFARGV